MAIWGADIQQLRALGAQLNSKAGEIDGILSNLTNLLNNTQWQGPDATRFHTEWTGQHTAALRQVASALRDAASKAQQNAAQQEQASNS